MPHSDKNLNFTLQQKTFRNKNNTSTFNKSRLSVVNKTNCCRTAGNK